MHNYGHWKKTLALLVMSALSLGASSVDAMPEGGVVRSGSGSVTQNGKEMTIRQDSGRLAMDWTGFSVGKDETVRFQQPGKDALALNRVTGNQQSVIDGSLLSNGHVLLVNPNGVVIGKNASIDVGGLVASTAQVKDNFMKEFGNSTGAFSLGGVSDGKIINEGTIKAEGGLVALHAAKVENSGTISNTGGSAVLAAADTLTLTPDADGKLNFTVDGKTAEASALNKGAITADGGTIVMTADSASDVMSTVVNNSGTLQARTLRKNEKGQILLEGGDKGQVEVSGTLDASGTEEGQSAGNIKVIGEKTIVHDGTNLLARGNVDGGKIETSGDVLNLGDNLNIDAKGVSGKAGEWLLDPLEILIQDDSPALSDKDQTVGTVNGGSDNPTQINYNDPPSETQNADATYSSTSWIQTKLITEILNKGTDVTIQAASTSQAASITVNSAIKPKVEGDREATLTLEAQRNITINNEIKTDANGGKLNVKLNSDTDGDGVGAVIINADISTNGGTFTSGSGGNVKFTAPSGTKAGAYAATGIEKDTKPNIAGHTVGTYFGYIVPEGQSAIELLGEKNNRNITTNGGAITLDGEVAIGLNGGALTLDTSKKDGTAGGNVNITGIINSGNSYDTYIFGTEKWNQLVEKLVQKYMDHNTVPSYRFVGINYTKNKDGTYSYTTQAKHFDKGESHYAFHELKSGDVKGSNWTYPDSEATLDTQHTRWYATTVAGDGYNSFIMEGTTPETSQMSIDDWLIYYRRTEPDNYATKYANGNKDTNSNLVTYEKIQNDPTKMATLKSDISALIAHNWFASETLAKSGTGSDPGDSYLATITTALENSLSTPNSQKTLWVGGMGSGVRNKTNDKTTNPYSQYPADPSHQDGFYWVTGPEGLVTTTVTNADGTTTTIKGTKFWDTSKSYWNKDLKKSNYGEQVYGYTKWSSWSGGGQPDNSAPFLTVGYGNNNAWDDAAIDGGTTVGFVQETNLYNSSLNIKTDGGKVTLQGDLGKSVGLDTVKIDAGSGSVTTGNTQNTATKYNNGTIYADHGVYINGGEVTVGGEIHSGGTDVEATRNTDSSFSDYLDNVTILSFGNIEVHGITSNTYDDGTTTTRGGKISLTSTGTEGVITLGDGVDYSGNATDGTLAAASKEKGAVVVDAQGSQGSLVNSTKGTAAITTGTDGTWQVYVNSPSDYGTSLGSNLNSGTNAQWTAKSDANTAVKTNSSNNNLTNYTDTSSNKFIFQVTPVITISGGHASKTYGDTLSEETMANTLISKATYKDSQKNDIDVTSFKKNFDESHYLDYVISSDSTSTKKGLSTVNVSSNGAARTATRTNGNEKAEGSDEYKTADDKNRAFYVMNVAYQDGVKTLNGYDKAANPGEVEIKRKTLTINTDATQTYGNATVTSGTPEDYSAQLVNGDTLDAGDITYTIATDGTYATSKGSKTTAHAGIYENQYLTSDAAVKASDGSDASANYAVTGSGTITVDKADLTLTLKDVSTTYGNEFDGSTYGYKKDAADLQGLTNGDAATAITDVLQDSDFTYVNGGAKSDPNNENVKTQNAGSYQITGSTTRTLDNYNIKVVNPGTSTVEKAKLTLTVGDVSTVYGTGFDRTKYTYTISGNANGDTDETLKNNQISVNYTNTGEKADANNDKVKTQDVGDWKLIGNFTVAGDTDNNYDVTYVNGTSTVTPAEIHLKLNDVSTTYGTAFTDTNTYGYDVSKLAMANGDSTDVVTKAIGNGDITYTNTGDATDPDKIAKGAKTQDAGTGYQLTGTTERTLKNYKVFIDGADATINKATLKLKVGDYTEAYGAADKVGADLKQTEVTGEQNGDDLADLVSEIGIHNTSKALLSDTRTNDVKYKTDGSLDSYDITTDFKNSLDNYNVVQDKTGSVTLKPKEITIKNTMTQEYGSSDRIYKEATVPEGQLANGDTIFTKDLKFDIKSDGEYAKSLAGNKKKNSEAVTADAGTYTSELIHTGGGIIHKDGTDAYKNYKVTVEGDIIVNPKDITTRANGTGSTLDNLSWDVKNDSLANGDVWGKDVLFDKTYGDMISYADRTFGVKSFINGTQISDGTKIGNYIYHPTGIVQLTFNPIVKPDVWAHSGGYRPRNKIETSLPVFRVEDAKVGQYGTYGVEHNEEGDRLVLSATGMRLPEPDQVPDEERTFTTTLSTETGSGTFKLVYNGVSLKVYPQDKEAEETVRAGDKTKNVSLSEKALYVGYTEMGLDLIDLKGVYIYFN